MRWPILEQVVCVEEEEAGVNGTLTELQTGFGLERVLAEEALPVVEKQVSCFIRFKRS